MKTGDQIRFLDDVGGGIISRIDEKEKIVYVRDEDGFEMPAKMSQVVVVNNIKANNLPMTEKELLAVEKPVEQPQETLAKNTTFDPVEDEYETEYGDTLLVQLAFMPQNIRLLQSTPYDAILINDSNYYLFYNIATIQEKESRVIAHGMIEPNMTDAFVTINKDDLNDWEHLRIQAIPFKLSKKYQSQNVIDVDIKLHLVNFFKLHAFTTNEYFDQPAWIIDLTAKQPEQTPKSIQTQAVGADNFSQPKSRHRRIPHNQSEQTDNQE